MKRRPTSAQRKSNLEKLKKLRIGEESHIEINMSNKMTQQDLDKRRKSNLEKLMKLRIVDESYIEIDTPKMNLQKLKKLRIVDESHSERPMQQIIDSPNHPQTKQRLPITWYECIYCDGLRTKDEEYMYTHWRIHEWLFYLSSHNRLYANKKKHDFIFHLNPKFLWEKNMTSLTIPVQNFYGKTKYA